MSDYRKPVSNSASRADFKRNSMRVEKRNFYAIPMRGGIRL